MAKNIVLINLETYDYYKYGQYNHPGLPFLNRISSQGTICNNCYTTSAICVPSRHAIMTGCIPSKSCGILDVKFGHHSLDGKHTIGSVLKSKGYHTGYVGKSHLNIGYNFGSKECSIDSKEHENVLRKYMVKHSEEVEYIKNSGFDYVDRIFPNNPNQHPVRELKIHNDFWIFNGAYEFIDDNKDNDFFVYINPTLFHGPTNLTAAYAANPFFTPTGILDKASHVKSFKSNEDYIDYCIRKLFNILKKNNVLDNTVVFITGDHSGKGKFSFYEPGAHIPLTVWDGGEHKIIDHYISFIDFLPTFCEIAGINHEEIRNYEFDGVSQYDVLFNDGDRVRDHVYLELGTGRGIIKDGFKYIKTLGDGPYIFKKPDGKTHNKYHPAYFDKEQLYKLEDEKTNLINDGEYVDVLNEMREILNSYL
jgi:arylsulfatase